ncbi:hypothetical protein AGMMS49965_00940 [Bacteroidia bacterium]|nr:hypothetical protein AGMMS49965_00940 [Bacteroidia bacterium]
MKFRLSSFTIAAVFAASLLIVQACKEDDPLVTTGGILGTITNADTKVPLKGVSISLTPTGSTKVTGDDGSYAFENLDEQEYTLTCIKDDYVPSTKKVTVKANMNSNVDIALEPITPVLNVSTATLNFGSSISTLALDISNAGKGVLDWSIAYDSTWFACSPKAGTTEKTSSSVVVSVSRAGKERGSYTQVFAISSNGGSQIVTVSMEVGGIAWSAEPTALNFGTLTSSQQLTLTNNGTGSINYSAETSNEWIALSKTAGSITKNDYITVIVSREALSAGSYTGTITIQSGIENLIIPVQMDVAAHEQPVVGFEQITNIAYNSAHFNGTMVSVGSDKVTRYGFCWNTAPNPTVSNNASNLGDCTNPLAFESTATNLTHSTKYYVRAYAENSVGLSYSSEQSFTTAGVPTTPTVATGNVSEIASATAKAGGTVSSLGNEAEITQYGHVWSVNANPTIDLATRTNLGTLSVTGAYVSDIEGLSPNVQYHIRAYATNARGTAYGDDITFTTTVGDATLTTAAVTDIVHNAATCGGTITNLGGHTIVEQGVCWATTTMPTLDNHTVVAALSVANTFSCRITGLATTTSYHARAYVKTQTGAVYYGDNQPFTTTQVVSLPTAATTTVSNITSTRATLQSSITGDGNSPITDCGFVYATWQNPTIDAANKESCGTGTTSFGKSVTTLTEGTTYYVRAYATNAMGTAYGTEVTFTTTAINIPTLATVTVSAVGTTSATLQSSVTSNGNADVTEAGFCWSVNPYPTIYDSKQASSSTTTLSYTLTGLNSATTYYVRSYAINSKGTSYSDENNFTTITPPTNVIFVSYNGDNSNDGRSWESAKKTIAAAMTAATSGYQVWVRTGTYEENVTLKEGVDVYGGFSGTESSVGERTAGSKTTLLGSRFIQGASFSTNTVVDGFTVSTVSTAMSMSGGLTLNNVAFSSCTNTIGITNSTLTNCSLTNNTKQISLTGCTVSNSTISDNTNDYIVLSGTTINSSTMNHNVFLLVSNGEINNSTITNNTISGVSLNSGSLTNCKIQGNTLGVNVSSGGGSIVGCLITGNSADVWYYGIFIGANIGTRVNIYNCTINNAVPNYSGRYSEIYTNTGDVRIINSIVYPKGSSSASIVNNSATLYVSNTISANTFATGTGNVTVTSIDDYMLDSDYNPQSGSPAVNAGDNSLVSTSKDVNGNVRVQGGTVDIGAVESSY